MVSGNVKYLPERDRLEVPHLYAHVDTNSFLLAWGDLGVIALSGDVFPGVVYVSVHMYAAVMAAVPARHWIMATDYGYWALGVAVDLDGGEWGEFLYIQSVLELGEPSVVMSARYLIHRRVDMSEYSFCVLQVIQSKIS